MSERLEDDKAYIRLFNQNTKLSKRVKELEESLEHGAKVAVKTAEKLHYEQQQNKRYREAIEKARRELETCARSAYLTLSKALEESK